MMHSDAPLASMTSDTWQLDVEAPLEFVQDVAVEEAAPEPAASSSRPEEVTPPPLPRILESLFFASHEPLNVEKLGKIIRGISAGEISTIVADLNQHYKKFGCPYHIQLLPTGYRMALRARHRPILENLFGGVKEVRFSQLAIETLAIVAYRQPITATEIEVILGQECTVPLRQLIRRAMVQMQGKNEQQEVLYGTTPRFLEFFQLNKVDDLPRADDLERL